MGFFTGPYFPKIHARVPRSQLPSSDTLAPIPNTNFRDQKEPIMPTITLYITPDNAPENGEHIEVGLTDGGFIHPQVARAIAGTTAERLILTETRLELLHQPWFWSVALAAEVDFLDLGLEADTGLGWVEETLRGVGRAAGEVVAGTRVELYG